ncbi:MAG: hypothetical protein ACI9EP_000896 [Oceanospirillaceae bacterium]|jgi:hypothetical protein
MQPFSKVSKAEVAIAYMHKNWKKLTSYTQTGKRPKKSVLTGV